MLKFWRMNKRDSTPIVVLAFLFAGCSESGGQRLSDIVALDGDPTAGAQFYADECETCHGTDATGGSSKGIAGEPEDVVVEATLEGPGAMPSFTSASDQELADVAAFVASL